jgi:hypothetical protein
LEGVRRLIHFPIVPHSSDTVMLRRPALAFSAAALFSTIAIGSPASAEAQASTERPAYEALPEDTSANARRSGARTPFSDRPAREAAENEERERVRFGPLVGVGFPRPLAIEALVKIKGLVAVGAEYSFLPRMNIAGADTRFNAIAADLRIFPFRGAFFIGLRGGRQWLEAAATVQYGPLALRETMAASTWFLNPRVGILHTFRSGFTLGIDAGVQLPISPSFERAGLAAAFGASGTIDPTLSMIADALGNGVTPTLDLLRVGFLF